MNPIHNTMQADITGMHRQACRTGTASARRSAITRIRWCAIGLLTAAMALLAGAPAALAVPLPPPGGNAGTQVAPLPGLNPAGTGGTPGWQIVLIAVGAAVVASALTLLAVRAARRTTPAQPSRP